MEPQTILYETLTPFALSAASPPPTPPQQPPSPPQPEHYAVIRNQIPTTSVISPPEENTETADYFSLDVFEDANDVKEVKKGLIRSPKVASSPRSGGEERRLEASWFRSSCRFKSPMLQLHKEILDFCDFLSPTPEEQDSRNEAVECVSDVIKYIWPNCKVEVFGSFKTGLYLPSSDIDVVILNSDIKSPAIGLHALSRALSQRGIAKKIQVIGKARVPIIKFVEKRSGVSFDISFDVENGPKAAEFIQAAISKWPPLKPLCLILKVFLQQRELNEVYSGGIGSYALLAMLIATIRSSSDYRGAPEQNLGVLLVNFFDIYGRKLSTSDVGVSCNGEGTFFSKRSKGYSNQGRSLIISIEDPQAPENDIGKSSFNYFQIRSAFAMAFTMLTNAKLIASLGDNKSILGTIIRPDAVLLERKGGSNGDVTFTKLLPGAGEPFLKENVDDQDFCCNWQLDDEEEPLPRGNASVVDTPEDSSKKKRKLMSKEKHDKKKKVKLGKEVKDSSGSGSTKKRPRRFLKAGRKSKESGS